MISPGNTYVEMVYGNGMRNGFRNNGKREMC